jgi:BMFP domain-containing protein YqiC
MLAGKDTIDDVAKAVTEEYEVDFETARKDVETLVKQLAEYGVVEL